MPHPKMTFLDAGSASEVLNQQKQAMHAMAQTMQVPDEHLDGPLTQSDMDEYIRLSKAYLGGPDIPFEIQLLAYDKHGEEPTGIMLDKALVGDMTMVEFLRIMIPLRDRKDTYGVAKGVDDPEKFLKIKQQAVLIYTRCVLEIAEAEAIRDDATERLLDFTLSYNERLRLEKIVANRENKRVFFPDIAGATLGRNGYIHLFPGYPDSPAGMFRGDGAAYDVMECIDFISKHFPDVEDQILASLADA